MNLPFFIARRYLFSKKSHNAINIITLISVFCVAIVTIALVIILSGLNGLTNLVESRYNSFNADIQITVRAGKTFGSDSLTRLKLRALPEVAACSEVLEENVLLNFNEKQVIGTMKGVGPEFEAMTHFDTLMRWGRFNLGGDSLAYAVIGRGLEQRLDIPNENNFTPLRVFIPKKGADLSPNPGSLDQPFNKKNVYVSGAFTIADDFDYKYMLVSIGFARKLLGDPKATSSIELSLKPGADKKKVQDAVRQIMGDAFLVKNRYQQNELLFKTLQSEKLWTSMILVFVLIIATFNIIGSLTMLIIEKQKDIHTLSSMGADVGLIRNIFFTEGLMISFLGSISGLVIGVLICLAQIKYGLVRFGEGKMVVDAYPVAIEVSDLIAILVLVMLIGFFAAWYPVRVFTRKHTVSPV